MNNITKKIVAIITTVTCAVWLVGPGMAQALTATELQAQIDTLLATIATLQAQITAMQGGTTAAPAVCAGITFSRNLSQGMSGTDVKCLQAILNQTADTRVAASGVGSSGAETNYFGSLTKAAVVNFQEKYATEVLAPIGLTQGTGFVGAKTIAKLNSILAGTTPTTPTTTLPDGCTSTAGYSPTTGVSCSIGTTTPTTPTLPTAEGLTVTLASDTPAATTIVSDGASGAAGSQALVPYLKLNFSTPVGTTAKVTALTLKRIGISTDTDIPNVYLYEGDTKLAEMTSLSLGVVNFTNAAGLFTVSGVKTITVKADLHQDALAGKTIGFSVVAATSITTDASAVNGTFPMNGSIMTTAVVADFGRLTLATSTNSATVDPGTTGFEAMRIVLTAGNQKMVVKSIKFLQLGSIQKTDIANLALYVGSTQLGSTVASLAADGTVTFDLSSYEIPAGVARIISLKVDVIGGSTRNIRFSIQRSTDIVAMDNNYGVYVTPDTVAIATFTVQDSTATLVAAGNLTITRRTDSPSGNIALNSTNVSLAKFDVKAVGENIKISLLTFNASPTASAWNNLTNVRLYYDGVQVGTAQTIAASSTNYPITLSFTALVGATKVLEVKADVKSSPAVAPVTLNAGDTITMQLVAGLLNAQRMVSLGSINFPAATTPGNALTVIDARITASKNATVGNVSAVLNQQGVTIGSYLVSAGAAEGVDISKFIFEDCTTTNATVTGANNLGAAFSNLALWYGTTQLGSTIVPNPTAPAATYEFNPSAALSLAAGQSVRVDLKGDVIQGAAWLNGEGSCLITIESTGKVTTNAANFTTGVVGQALTLSGAGTLSGATDPSTPDAAIVAMGDTGKVVGIWKLSANTIEPITVSKIMVFNDGIATSVANFMNLKLYCGSTQFGTAVESLSPAVAAYGWVDPYTVFAGSCVVPKGGNTIITLKSDINTYGDGGQSGQYGRFYVRIPTPITGAVQDVIVARGAGDYSTSVGSTSTANRVYPYRTSLTSALACSGFCTGRTRSATDKVAVLTLTGTASVDAQLRAALNGEDNTGVGWVIPPVGATATEILAAIATATDAVNFLDGAASVQYTASTSNPGAGVLTTTTYAAVNMGTSLVDYSKLSLMWRVNTVANVKAATLFVGWKATSTWADRVASTSVATTTLVADKWFTAEMDLAGLTASNTYVGLAIAMSVNTTLIVKIDAVRVYNDSIVVDITGNATDTNRGKAVYLKTSGGTEKAVGYYDYLNSRVILVPSSEISVGATAVALDVITDTTAATGIMEAAATGISRTLTLSTDLGSVDSAGTLTAGDFRWYDQAVNVSTPITWMNGASPISVTISLASGN